LPEREDRIRDTKMRDLAVFARERRQNFLKVRVGHGTCPNVISISRPLDPNL